VQLRLEGRRRAAVIACSVFAIALLVRVSFLLATPDRAWPHSILYEGDAPVWVRWARALDRGEPFEFDLPMRTPGVAFALHWFAPIGADASFTALKLVWCAISAATCAAVFVVARSMFSPRAALIAAGWLCFSFGSYELATSLDNETPYALLVVVLVGATARLVERPSPKLALLTGALHGLALLLRAEHALLLAAMLAWAGWRLARARDASAGDVRDERKSETRCRERSLPPWAGGAAARVRNLSLTTALVAAAALAVCLPWSLRSHRAVERFNTVTGAEPDLRRAQPPWTAEAQEFFARLPAFARPGNFAFLADLSRAAGKREVARADVEQFFREQFGYVPEPLATWTLVSSKGALDFALANHRASDGGFSLAGLSDGHDADPQFSFGRPSHLRLYNRGYEVGLAAIRADFGAWLALVGRKLERFGDGVTLGLGASDWPHGVACVREPVDIATPANRAIVWSLGTMSLLVAGIALAWRRGAVWLIVIAYKLAVTVLFYGYARQAASIAPAFAVFGAVALDALLARCVRSPRIVAYLAVAVVLALLASDGVRCADPPQFDVRAVEPTAKIRPAGEWGAGAFESASKLELTPRR
jgi:hypothetical protein